MIHSAASLILLWGGFPCQEAPAWPPAHQPHLAPAYRRPAAHALPLRVGGESRLAGLGSDTFWQELLSPHSAEWRADCSGEHKRPQVSKAASCGLQAYVEMLASILYGTVAVFSTLMATTSQFITNIYGFCYLFKQSLKLKGFLPSVLLCSQSEMWQPIVKAVGYTHQLIQCASCSVIMRSVKQSRYLTHGLRHTTCATEIPPNPVF